MPIPSWLGSLATGVLSAGGTLVTNQANRDMSGRQMRFQERMSSTAAQRAVKDYTLAGLNPALAYDRPASSPGGASAVMGDSVNTGINSAQSARQLQAQLDLTRASTAKMSAEAEKANVEAGVMSGRLVTPAGSPSYLDEVLAKRTGAIREVGFEGTMQPHRLRQLQLANVLSGADVNRKELVSSLSATARAALDLSKSGYRMLPGALSAGLSSSARGASALNDYLRQQAARAAEVRRRLNKKTQGGW